MRLIEDDAILAKLAKMINYCETNNMGKELTVLFQVGDAVMDCPTIDAVPVDTVSKMFCDFTGDSCACDFNGNDEWLPEVCELQDECPNPKDNLGCWKQYIKHFGERKE